MKQVCVCVIFFRLQLWPYGPMPAPKAEGMFRKVACEHVPFAYPSVASYAALFPAHGNDDVLEDVVAEVRFVPLADLFVEYSERHRGSRRR